MQAESTRTMLFGLLVVANQPLTTGQIIALAEPLGLSATNVKSHLTRMVADGSVRRAGPRRFARYSPTPDGHDRIQAISARLDVREGPRWDGQWLLLSLRSPSARRARDQVRASLWFDGFRPCSADVYLRPAWPTPWALIRAQAYVARGLAICVHGALLGNPDRRRVRAMYGLDALDRGARRLANEIEEMQARPRSAAETFAIRLDVGGRMARLMAHDPRLPAALWEARTGMRDLRQAYLRFEKRVGTRAQAFVDRVIKSA